MAAGFLGVATVPSELKILCFSSFKNGKYWRLDSLEWKLSWLNWQSCASVPLKLGNVGGKIPWCGNCRIELTILCFNSLKMKIPWCGNCRNWTDNLVTHFFSKWEILAVDSYPRWIKLSRLNWQSYASVPLKMGNIGGWIPWWWKLSWLNWSIDADSPPGALSLSPQFNTQSFMYRK